MKPVKVSWVHIRTAINNGYVFSYKNTIYDSLIKLEYEMYYVGNNTTKSTAYIPTDAIVLVAKQPIRPIQVFVPFKR